MLRANSQGPGNFSRSAGHKVFDDLSTARRNLEAHVVDRHPEVTKDEVKAMMDQLFNVPEPKKISLRAVTSATWAAEKKAVEELSFDDLKDALDKIYRAKIVADMGKVSRAVRVKAQNAVAAHGPRAQGELEAAAAAGAECDAAETRGGDILGAVDEVVDEVLNSRNIARDTAKRAAELLSSLASRLPSSSAGSRATASALSFAGGTPAPIGGTAGLAAREGLRAPEVHKEGIELRAKLVELSELGVRDLRAALKELGLPSSAKGKDLLLSRLRAHWIEKKAPVGYSVQTYVARIKLLVVGQLKAELSQIGQVWGGKKKDYPQAWYADEISMQSELISLYQNREWPLSPPRPPAPAAAAARRGSALKRQRGGTANGARAKRPRKVS